MPTFPSIPANTILLYTIVGDMNAQTILTTFHYKVIGSSGDEGYNITLDRFLAYQFGTDGLLTKMLPFMPSNYTVNTHRVQPIYPTRQRYIEASVGGSGDWPTGNEIQNVAMSIKRLALSPTRQGVGRIQLPFPSALANDGSIVLGTIAAELAAFTDACNAEFTPTDSTVAFQPVLFGKDANGNYQSSPVYTHIPMSTVRTMHRRTVGLGI